MKPTLIKSLILFSFVFFITTFLLYRMGKFDGLFNGPNSSLQTSPNGGTINSTKPDTIKPAKKDSLELLRLSSSKSTVIVEKDIPILDSLKKKYGPKKKELKESEMLSSSKSAMIFRPNYSFADSLRKDSLKRKQEKIKQQ